MKELLRTTNPTVIPYATALLQGEGIEVFDVDVHMHTLESTLGMMPRRLLVRREDHFMASSILRENGIPLHD
ncbi:MAG: Protein of unknown function (DUF2007) [Roseibaca calidilacus]|uniref:Signal transducing protein n=1 Tax=Roseibaca calidilacus TaxID=1666912 RepID=A0A0N8K7V4_9RHOB|nr:DUF2007 domain-containing protein [Roseibaca calidilacus]KPP92785.1 MAG: Protein of unknown function (DUF2007) [Roseibaca calidilacus]CUX80143.1 Putative signal transducing protein [Roseibaca calidilacus]